ncbi:MAG: MBL fold metallo-hydrolase [Gemmatimonadetes bacterium]|nr:MBL fold metallo-hydrolase [Gemmatimonadota bacterium]
MTMRLVSGRRLSGAFVPMAVALAVLYSGCTSVESSDTDGASRASEADSVDLRYLGAAGWEISASSEVADSVVVLVDPYLTRAKYGAEASWDPMDTRPNYTRADTLFSDTDLIDAQIARADYILVQHAHPDHIMDVPYIAQRTGAVVIGHETTINIMRAYGIPAGQLITVRGGEDYDFGNVSIRVIPSLHSPLNDKRYYQSEVVEEGVQRPLRISELVEGGSLMYLVRIGGHEILTMGSMNFIEREVQGLRPDIALVGAAPSHLEITGYTPRLMEALGFPRVVIPTHADNFQAPYGSEIAYRTEWVEAFASEVRNASPGSHVLIPKHLEPIRLSLR